MKFSLQNILLFSAFAFFMLAVRNADVLYTLAEQSLFVPGQGFWEETVPAIGVVGWIGCWLTQFLHIPWLGAVLLILLWVVIYYALVYSFRLKGVWTLLALIPVAVLLVKVISLGYHVFYLRNQAIAFTPTLYTLLVAVGLLLIRFFFLKKLRLPSVKMPKYVNIAAFVLFWTAFVVTAFHFDYSDRNYHHELRMARSMDECRWNDVLSEFDKHEGRPTNLMVLLKNISLLHTGRITEMFCTDNRGTQPYVRDSLAVHLSQQAAPMIYYQLGMFNFAYRWAMENSVQYGLSVGNLKMMTRCAIWNGETELADKYLNLLAQTLFFKDWAAEHRRWMHNAGSFQSHPEYKAIVPLLTDEPDVLDYDQAACEKFILDYYSDLRTDRPGLEDFTLCVSLLTESESDFVEQLDLWLQHHPYEPLPILYQEAALMMSESVFAPPWLAELPFDAAVTNRFQQFGSAYYALSNRGLTPNEMASQLRSTFGNTYWWYYYFYDDFNIY